MARELMVQRDRRLEPLQGRALVKRKDENLVRVQFGQPRTRTFFKPLAVVFLFMATAGTVAFFIGAFSL